MKPNAYYFVVPLVLAISLVYSATRHESWRRIWHHAFRLSGTILAILVVATLLLLLINTQL